MWNYIELIIVQKGSMVIKSILEKLNFLVYLTIK
jgi:hypothetical protein